MRFLASLKRQRGFNISTAMVQLIYSRYTCFYIQIRAMWLCFSCQDTTFASRGAVRLAKTLYARNIKPNSVISSCEYQRSRKHGTWLRVSSKWGSELDAPSFEQAQSQQICPSPSSPLNSPNRLPQFQQPSNPQNAQSSASYQRPQRRLQPNSPLHQNLSQRQTRKQKRNRQRERRPQPALHNRHLRKGRLPRHRPRRNQRRDPLLRQRDHGPAQAQQAHRRQRHHPGHEQEMEQVDHGGRDAGAGEARTRGGV